MDKTYAWHPGANEVAAEWGLPVALMPDELFSGWLTRVALTQGCSISTLMASIWPGLRFHDVDRGLPTHQLAVLSKSAGINMKSFHAAMLTRSERLIRGLARTHHSIWRWILPLGLRSAKRPQGAQYCPACWATDASAYMRLQWRFAWHIACETHHIALLDHCFQCNAPIRLHRSQCIHRCRECGADLCTAPQISADVDALCAQQTADQVLHAHVGNAWGSQIEAADWFQLLALLVSFFRRETVRESEKLTVLACEFGRLSQLDKVRLELLCTEERKILLALICRTLTMPREQVMNLISDAGYSRQALVVRANRLSPSLQLGWKLFPDKSVSPKARGRYAPRPRHLVKAMMIRLCRHRRDSA